MKTGIKSTQKNRRQRAPTANRPNQFRDRKTNPKASPMSIRGGGATEVLTDPPNVLILPRLCTLGIPACRAIGEHYVCPSTTWRQFGRAPPRPAWGEPPELGMGGINLSSSRVAARSQTHVWA